MDNQIIQKLRESRRRAFLITDEDDFDCAYAQHLAEGRASIAHLKALLWEAQKLVKTSEVWHYRRTDPNEEKLGMTDSYREDDPDKTAADFFARWRASGGGDDNG